MATTPKAYRCRANPIGRSRFVGIIPQARAMFRTLQKQTKRRPYVRSTYFSKDKVFFDFFWQHMEQKLPSDRARRLKYFPCALELMRKARNDPVTYIDPTQPNGILHRFLGKTSDGRLFWVLVREDRRTDKKQLLTIFPHK